MHTSSPQFLRAEAFPMKASDNPSSGDGKRYAVRTKPLAWQTLRVLVGRGSLFDPFAFTMQKE
jgi:hypothetical protein